MTLQDYVFKTYNALLDAGWHMAEIDSMDILGYFRVRAYDAVSRAPKRKFIDEVWKNG